MADASLGAVVRHLRQIVPPPADPRDDRELLDAFAARHDQAAFAVLVRRHGAMVLNVCRRVLHHEQDAEDAFQATFLVLAAKAQSLRLKTTLAGFLHGVAYHLALKSRRETVRRQRREARAQVPACVDAAAELNWHEVQAVLEEEIQRLPDKYRMPFVLCCLEGVGRAEAGRQLGLKEGTVWSRLSQARERLRQRLTRRGIALSAALGVMAVSDKTLRASLVETLIQAAKYGAAGSMAGAASARVALLTQAGLRTMMGKMKLVLVGLAALLAVSAGGAVFQVLTAKPPETPASTTPQAKAAAEPKKPEAPRLRTDRHGDPLPEGAIARLGTVRWRHGFFVQALAYSPDGKKIAAVGAGRAITLWDAVTGKETCQFPVSSAQPLSLAFSPDGKVLATADVPICHLWDVATGKEVRQLKGHQSVVRSVAFSPDGKLVATASGDGTMRLWDPTTGEERRRLDCGSQSVGRLAYSPDGKTIAWTSLDGVIHLWDPATGKERRQLKGHDKTAWCVVFSPDGKRLASSSEDETIRVWDPATGRQVGILGAKLGASNLPLAFSPDGKLLASGYRDGAICLWDATTGAEQRRWRGGSMSVRALAFSPDGKTLASGAVWESIRLWDVATGREKHPSEEHLGIIDFLRFAPDGASLVSIGRERRMLWWDLTTQTPRHRFSWAGKGVNKLALSPDGNTLAAGGWPDNEVRLWDARTGKPGRLLGKYPNGIAALTFSPDGRLVACGEEDQGIHVLDVRDGEEVRHMKGIAKVMSLRFSPDSKALACGIWTSGKTSLRLWNVASGKETCSFECFDQIGSLAFSPDGKVLATSVANNRDKSLVRLWDTATGKELRHYTGHRDDVGALAFSPNGKLVVSGSGSAGYLDNSVHVWEAATGRLIRRFEGHHSCVGSVAFSPDGLTAASGAGDSTILLWDITGRQKDGRLSRAALTPRQLDACWAALAGEDAAKAYDAVWALVASAEQALPFLQKHLRPVPRPDAKVVARLIADLDSNDFPVRDKATEELGKLSDAAAPALRRALALKPALEVRKRLQQLLDQTRDWNAERLRAHRAIQALAHVGTPEVQEVLEALAAGAPGTSRTEEARAALQRLGR